MAGRASDQDFLVGSELGHYRMVEKIGGWMSVVFETWDTHLQGFVPLKFLPGEVPEQPRALARLQREAQAASLEGFSALQAPWRG